MFPVLIMLKNITHALIFVVIWLLDDHLVFIDLLRSYVNINFLNILGESIRCNFVIRLTICSPNMSKKTTKIDQHKKISSISLKSIWSASLLGMLWNWAAFCAYYVVYLPKNNNATVEFRCEMYKNWMGVSLWKIHNMFHNFFQ